VCDRRLLCVVALALTVVPSPSASASAAAAKPRSDDLWVVVHGQAGTADKPDCTANGGFCHLRNVSWTEIYRYRAEIVGGEETLSCPTGYPCGTRPWKAVASGTGSITGSRSESENCTNTISAPDGETFVFFGVWSRMQLALDAQTLQLDTYSPMEAAGFALNPPSCPVDGGYWPEGTGQMSAKFSARQLAKGFGTSFTASANSRGGGDVSWLGTITVINGGGPPALTPVAATPSAVTKFERTEWVKANRRYAEINQQILNIAGADKSIAGAVSAPVFDFFLKFILNGTDNTNVKVITELRAVANDPPRSDFLRIAHVAAAGTAGPSPALRRECQRVSGAKRQRCLRVGSALEVFTAAIRRFQSLTSALAVTIDRESGARRAGNDVAAARQARAALALLTKLRAGDRAEATAAHSLARALQSAAIDPQFSAAQISHSITLYVERLARHGITATELAGALPSAQATTLVALLRRW
jgi:hypothetical protein